jgi:hypothetical protein
VRGLTSREVAQLPAYPGGAVDGWLERSTTSRFSSAPTAPVSDEA